MPPPTRGLATAFETHLEETRRQVERIEQIAELLQIKIKRIKCEGMAGLVEEGDSLIDQIEKGPVLDAALIGAARKFEHYEIAGYNSLCTLAKKLGHTEAVSLLEASLAEETATDSKLSAFAEGRRWKRPSKASERKAASSRPCGAGTPLAAIQVGAQRLRAQARTVFADRRKASQ